MELFKFLRLAQDLLGYVELPCESIRIPCRTQTSERIQNASTYHGICTGGGIRWPSKTTLLRLGTCVFLIVSLREFAIL
jgi:hypothetical protein